LTLDEIEHVTNNLPQMLALKTQPVDFMHYVFTESRPLLEVIDSDVTFINVHTQRMYGADAKQLAKHVKPKGIEVEAVPNQQIQLKETTARGGVLTMPGILAMNRGPILRGMWVLERILGQELPDPPPDVGQVPGNRDGQKLSFRERFEQHRSNPTCAVCHDQIDPLGFVFQDYGNDGQHLANPNAGGGKKKRKKNQASDFGDAIDTSGKLPSGETFQNADELKEILTTTRRDAVIRSFVRRTMSYALSRKLRIYDQPTVNAITQDMSQSNGTWRDLFVAIARSVQFREAVFPSNP